MTDLKEFKILTPLVLFLKKIESQDKTKYDTFYSHGKAETIINGSVTDHKVFKSIYISKKQISLYKQISKVYCLHLWLLCSYKLLGSDDKTYLDEDANYEHVRI